MGNVKVIKDDKPVVIHDNPMVESTLDPDWNAQYKRANVRSVLARCYIAVTEIDYDLRMWRSELKQSEG